MLSLNPPQCERCSEWFHGLCVGFREESAVPDLWICRSCRGLTQTVGNRNSTTSAGLNASGARHRASSGRVRSRSRRTQGSGQPPPSIPVQRQETQESGDGGEEGQRRNSIGLRRAASAPIEATRSASPRLTPPSMASVPSLVRASSTSSAPPEATATSSRGRGKAKGRRRSSSDSPSSSQEPLTEAPPRRVRGRRMPETLPVSATQAESLAAQDSTKASLAIPPPVQSRTSPRLSQSSAAQLAPTRGRERPLLLELPPESTRTTKRPASPATVPPRRCDDRPLLSLTVSSSASPVAVAETSVSTEFTAAASFPALSAQAVSRLTTAQLVVTTPPTVSSHTVPAPTVPAPVVSAQSVPLRTVQTPVVPDPVAPTCTVPAPGLPVPAVSAPVMSTLTVPAPSVQEPNVTMPDVPEAAMPNVGVLVPAIGRDITMPAPVIPVAGTLAQVLQTTAVEMSAVSQFTQDKDRRRHSKPPPRDLGSDTFASSESSSPVPEENHLADADVSRRGKVSLKEGKCVVGTPNSFMIL